MSSVYNDTIYTTTLINGTTQSSTTRSSMDVTTERHMYHKWYSEYYRIQYKRGDTEYQVM